jgi:small-conductance mechanosensitive channel
VKTFDGAEVIVPNGDLIAQQLTNWTRSDQRRRQTLPVKVAFGSDPRRVEEILVKVAAEHPQTLDDPAPMALFDGTTETGMNFNLLWWVPFDSGMGARNDVAVASHEALLAAGIAAPIPMRRVTNQPPEAR